MTTAKSTPNIALIKYWGNSNDELRLCSNDSLAMTLDVPAVEVAVDHADELSVSSVTMGVAKPINQDTHNRFLQHIQLTKRYLKELGADQAIPASLNIEINSDIPPAIGLASSAAVFSALATAISGLVADEIALSDEQLSVLARLGSGSAARSIFGGFGAIEVRAGDAMDSVVGWQVADEHHWQLHDIILVPSHDEKKVGSSQGHPGAHSSPHFKERVQTIQDYRQGECITAIQERDFERLQRVAEIDCMNMHEQIMQQQKPPLNYLSDATYRIIDDVVELRRSQHLPVLYTMDAGPTVHLFCENESVEAIRNFAAEQADCEMFEAKVGPGASIIS